MGRSGCGGKRWVLGFVFEWIGYLKIGINGHKIWLSKSKNSFIFYLYYFLYLIYQI